MSRAAAIGVCALALTGGLGGGLVDPTQPPAHAPSPVERRSDSAPDWRLTSVLVSPERRVAIINGVGVQPGDRLGDARVVDITLNAVTLDGPSGQVTLTLYPKPVRREKELLDD